MNGISPLPLFFHNHKLRYTAKRKAIWEECHSETFKSTAFTLIFLSGMQEVI